MVWSLVLCPDNAKQDPVMYGAEYEVLMVFCPVVYKFGKCPIPSITYPLLSTFFVPGFTQTERLEFQQKPPGYTRFCPLPENKSPPIIQPRLST